MGDSIVRNDEVVGSSPTSSTILLKIVPSAHSLSPQTVMFITRPDGQIALGIHRGARTNLWANR